MLVAGCTDATEDPSPAVGSETATTAASQPTTSAPPPADAAEEVVITISNFTFDVPDTIAPGTQVTIRNEDRVGHTVTSDEDGLFDVLVGGGQEATFTVPDQPGEYPFFCRPHPNMVATLVIG